MRHSYATWMLEEGADLRWVKDQLGHASIEETEGTYGHLAAKSDVWHHSRTPDRTPRHHVALLAVWQIDRSHMETSVDLSLSTTHAH
jgi:hypothetical protein